MIFFGSIDSAIYYYKKTYEGSILIHVKKDAARSLVKLYERQNKPEEANKYRKIYIDVNDSVSSKLEADLTANAYNEYVSRQKDADIQNEKKHAAIMKGLLILAVAFFASLFIFILKKVFNYIRIYKQKLREKERTLFIKNGDRGARG